MPFVVIDENVPMVANDAMRIAEERKTPQADLDCMIAAIERLERIVKGEIALVDAAGEVMACYRDKLNPKGAPGSGDAFFKHLSDHQYDATKVMIVEVEPHEDRTYVAFPSDTALSTFDRADRKFVALARSVDGAVIINAVDSDYSEHANALRAAGVRVQELCPGCLKKPISV